MARAVPPWLHRVCIRDHGPRDAIGKLLLFAINSFMDDAGECFPGQEAISKATCLGISTIRRKTAALSKEGWLALYPRGNSGRQWKSYRYRACVPDWVELERITVDERSDGETLANEHESVHGEIDQTAVSGTLYPQKGKPRKPPDATGSRAVVEGSTARSRHEHRPLVTEAPPAHDNKHRPQRRGKFQVLSSNGSLKGRSASADGVVSPIESSAVSQKTRDGRSIREMSKSERIRAARKFLSAAPDVSDDRLRSSYQLTDADIARVRQS